MAVDHDKLDSGAWNMPSRPPLPLVSGTGSIELIWLAAEWGLAHPVLPKSRESDHSDWLTPAKINPAVVRTRPGKQKSLGMALGGYVEHIHYVSQLNKEWTDWRRGQSASSKKKLNKPSSLEHSVPNRVSHYYPRQEVLWWVSILKWLSTTNQDPCHHQSSFFRTMCPNEAWRKSNTIIIFT